MSSSLLESLVGSFTPDIVGKAASLLGENESGLTKALSAGAPAILSGILNNASSDGGTNVFNLAKQAAGSGLLDNLAGTLGGGDSSSLMSLGSSLVSGLFGHKSSGLASLLSSFAGVKPSTGSSLLNLITPVALSLIGKHAIKNNLSSGSLSSWLGGQKDDIKKAIPSGFNLSSVFDDNVHKVSEPAHKAATYVEEKKTNWFLPLILGLLALGLLWYFMRSCNKPDEISAAPTPDTAVIATTVDTVKAAVVNAVRESLKVKLPDGTELDAWKGGIEDKLVACLNDATCKIGKDVWFDFDDLNFEMASAKITVESDRQVKNIAAILKAYPKVKIKIGGYTDKTGDAAANKKLSQERADATAAALKAAGAGAGQITGAEGYGSQFATVPAEASDAERQKDRHISISVHEK